MTATLILSLAATARDREIVAAAAVAERKKVLLFTFASILEFPGSEDVLVFFQSDAVASKRYSFQLQAQPLLQGEFEFGLDFTTGSHNSLPG